jgi:hypothetical protein
VNVPTKTDEAPPVASPPTVAVHIDPKSPLTPAEEALAEVLARIAQRARARYALEGDA